MSFEGTKQGSFLPSAIRGLITVVVLAILLAYPRNPPQPTVEKWSAGFPLHPFLWTTYAANLEDLWHRIITLSAGDTLSGQSITQILRANLWHSITLLSLSLLISLVIGVAKGVFDGVKSSQPSVLSTASSLLEWLVNSVPEFFLIFGLELLGFFLLRNGIHAYFVGSPVFWSGTLVPSFILGLAPMMYMSRAVKVAVTNQLGQLYIQTARSKGIGSKAIVWRHILPNCLPVISRNIGPMLGILFSGLVIIEYLFNRKGIGSGLFFAMGHDGINPIYGPPLGTPAVAEGHPFDVNLCVSYIMAACIVFVVFWAILRTVLWILGYKGIANSYGATMKDSKTGRLWSVQLVVGLSMLLVILLLALTARQLGLPAPNRWDVLHMDGNSMATPPFPPSIGHLLGTDSDGRDLLSRCIYGITPTFVYVFAADMLVLCIGTLMAILSASFNLPLIRFVIDTWDSVTSIVPGVILGLLILEIPAVYWAGVRIHPGHTTWGHIHQVIFAFVIALLEGGRVAGQLQVTLDTEHKRSYMEAAIISGNSNWTRFLLYDIRPLRDSVIEQGIVTFTRILLLMATLGFFEDVFQPEWLKINFGSWDFSGTSLDWGSLFAQNARDFITAPWVMFPPSIFVAWTAVSVNLIQNGVHRLLHTTTPRKAKKLSLAFRVVSRILVKKGA